MQPPPAASAPGEPEGQGRHRPGAVPFQLGGWECAYLMGAVLWLRFPLLLALVTRCQIGPPNVHLNFFPDFISHLVSEEHPVRERAGLHPS